MKSLTVLFLAWLALGISLQAQDSLPLYTGPLCSRCAQIEAQKETTKEVGARKKEKVLAKQTAFLEFLKDSGVNEIRTSGFPDEPTVKFYFGGMAYSLQYEADPNIGEHIRGERYCPPRTEEQRQQFEEEKQNASLHRLFSSAYSDPDQTLERDFGYSKFYLEGPRLFSKMGRLLKEENSVWFSQDGSLTYLHLPNGKVSDGYHSIFRLKNGVWVGQLGSLQFLLRDGRRISYGFQSIVPTANGYIAQIGAMTCRLDSNGNTTKECEDEGRLYPDR